MPFWARYRRHIVAVVFSVAITALILSFRDQLVCALAIRLPGRIRNQPSGQRHDCQFRCRAWPSSLPAASVLNPLLVGLVAGVAEPIGELTGYMAGYGGSAAIEDRQRFEQLKGWMQRRGFLTILVLSAIPNPLFDVAGIAAGVLHFPVPKFLLACWLGKTIKAIAIAYLGSLSLRLFG